MPGRVAMHHADLLHDGFAYGSCGHRADRGLRGPAWSHRMRPQTDPARLLTRTYRDASCGHGVIRHDDRGVDREPQ